MQQLFLIATRNFGEFEKKKKEFVFSADLNEKKKNLRFFARRSKEEEEVSLEAFRSIFFFCRAKSVSLALRSSKRQRKFKVLFQGVFFVSILL